MADVINLRRARKARDRRQREKQADANRLAFGRSSAEKTARRAEEALGARRHDAHRIDRREPGNRDPADAALSAGDDQDDPSVPWP